MLAVTQCPDSVNVASLAFLDDVIASWKAPEPDAGKAAAMLAQIAALVPNLVINARDGADYFDSDELRRYGYCDRDLNCPVRYPESADYLKGCLQAAQQQAA